MRIREITRDEAVAFLQGVRFSKPANSRLPDLLEADSENDTAAKFSDAGIKQIFAVFGNGSLATLRDLITNLDFSKENRKYFIWLFAAFELTFPASQRSCTRLRAWAMNESKR